MTSARRLSNAKRYPRFLLPGNAYVPNASCARLASVSEAAENLIHLPPSFPCRTIPSGEADDDGDIRAELVPLDRPGADVDEDATPMALDTCEPSWDMAV